MYTFFVATLGDKPGSVGRQAYGLRFVLKGKLKEKHAPPFKIPNGAHERKSEINQFHTHVNSW